MDKIPSQDFTGVADEQAKGQNATKRDDVLICGVSNELLEDLSSQTPIRQSGESRQMSEQNAQQGVNAEESLERVASYMASEIEIITGAEGINNCLAALSQVAEREVATFAPGGAQLPGQIVEARRTTEALFKRGIQSRSVFLSSSRNDRATLAYVEWLNHHGAEVRTTPILPIRTIIQDRKIAVLPVDPNNTMSGIVVCTVPAIITALQNIFEFVWDAANPLGEVCTPNKHGLSNEDKTILEQLALGRTKLEIAEVLGISDRSVRRRTDELFARLGTKSAFAACYRAVKQGWI